MEKELEFFRNNLNYLFKLSVVFKELKTNYLEHLEPPIDKIFISSVGRTYIQGLVSLFDPPEDQWGNKNLSAKLLSELNTEPYKETIVKLKKLRDKIISHNDVSSYIEPDKFVDGIGLTIEETDELLSHLIDIVEKARNEKMLKEEVRESTISALKKTLHIDT